MLLLRVENQNTEWKKPVNEPVNEPVKLNKIEIAILEAIKKNKKVTREQIAGTLNVSLITVKRALQKLKEMGLIERTGSDKSGHWEIL